MFPWNLATTSTNAFYVIACLNVTIIASMETHVVASFTEST